MDQDFQTHKTFKRSKKQQKLPLNNQQSNIQQKKKNNIFQEGKNTNRIISNVLMTTSIIKNGCSDIKKEKKVIQVEQQLLGSGNQQSNENFINIQNHRSDNTQPNLNIKKYNKTDNISDDNIFLKYLSSNKKQKKKKIFQDLTNDNQRKQPKQIDNKFNLISSKLPENIKITQEVIQFYQICQDQSQSGPNKLHSYHYQQSQETLQKNNQLNKPIKYVNENLVKSKQKLFGQNLIEAKQFIEKKINTKQKVQKNPFIKLIKQKNNPFLKQSYQNPFDELSQSKQSKDQIKKIFSFNNEDNNNKFFSNNRSDLNLQKNQTEFQNIANKIRIQSIFSPKQINKQNNFFNANRKLQNNTKECQKQNIIKSKIDQAKHQQDQPVIQINKQNPTNIFIKQSITNQSSSSYQNIQQPEQLIYLNKANEQLQKNLKQKQLFPPKSKVQYNDLYKSKKTKNEKLQVIKEQKMVDKNMKDFQKMQNIHDYMYTQKLFLPQKYISKLSSMGQQMNRLLGYECIKQTVQYLIHYIEQLKNMLKSARIQRKQAVITNQQLKKHILRCQAKIQQVQQLNQSLKQFKQQKYYIQKIQYENQQLRQKIRYLLISKQQNRELRLQIQQMQEIKQQNLKLKSQIYQLKVQIKNKQARKKLDFQFGQNDIQNQSDKYFQQQMNLIHKFFTQSSGYDVKQQAKKFNNGIIKILQNWPISQIKKTVHKISQVLIIGREVGRKYNKLKKIYKKCPQHLLFEQFQKLTNDRSTNQLLTNTQATVAMQQMEGQINEPEYIYNIIQKISPQQKDKQLFLFLEYKYVLLCSYLSQSFIYSTFSTTEWIDRCKQFQDDLNNYFAEKQINLSEKTINAESSFFQTFVGWQKKKQRQIYKMIYKQ